MSWFWLNIPLATLFFLAWTLIPLWLVLKHPEPGPRALTGAQPQSAEGSSPASLRAGGDRTPARRTAEMLAGSEHRDHWNSGPMSMYARRESAL